MKPCFVNRDEKCRIMVVDDDLDLLMLLERRLLKEGYEVETAISISEAEFMMDIFEPSVILLDINVKGEDGRAFCWKLKKDPIRDPVKVILMSGYDPDKGRARLFGADDAVCKPLHTDILLHLIEKHRAAV